MLFCCLQLVFSLILVAQVRVSISRHNRIKGQMLILFHFIFAVRRWFLQHKTTIQTKKTQWQVYRCRTRQLPTKRCWIATWDCRSQMTKSWLHISGSTVPANTSAPRRELSISSPSIHPVIKKRFFFQFPFSHFWWATMFAHSIDGFLAMFAYNHERRTFLMMAL